MVRGNSKQWIWRGTIRGTGQHVQIGLGAWNLYDLDEIREIALKYKRMARDGIDPRAKAREDAPTPTLADAISKVIDIKRGDWRDAPKTEARWRKITGTHAAKLLDRPVDSVGTGDIEAALLRIWHEKNATAIELQRFLSAGFAWAVVHGHRHDNPADLVRSQMPKVRKAVHQKSIPYADLADAIQTINASGAQAATKLAIEFLILTACRSGEVRGARWEEIDMTARVWTIPGERMKAGRPHRVPLSDRCIAILEAQRPRSSGLVFPAKSGKELSHATLGKLMRDLKLPGSPHGFRASFRTWTAQCTNAAREVCEDALAHVVGDAVERSYQRGDYFAKRVDLMNQWAQFVTAENIVTLHRATA